MALVQRWCTATRAPSRPAWRELYGPVGVQVAQEDHARRAVLAALDLRERWAHLTRYTPMLGSAVTMQLGLHSGLVVAGGPRSALPTALHGGGRGDPDNLRLQQHAAPGQFASARLHTPWYRRRSRALPRTPARLPGGRHPCRSTWCRDCASAGRV